MKAHVHSQLYQDPSFIKRVEQLRDEVLNHPHKNELIQLMREQALDDADMSISAVSIP